MPHSRAIRAAAALSAVLIAAIAWYLGSPLFIRTTANEALPTAVAATATSSATVPPLGGTPIVVTAQPARTNTSTTTISHRGQLQYVDALHNGKGTVLMGVVAGCCPVSDLYFLRFEDVTITNAPDVHVYLSTDTGGKWDPATSKYIGPLKATNGSFNYDVAPSDAGIYKSVVVWCRAFSVLVTWADLQRA
jgi:electron transfer DM13